MNMNKTQHAVREAKAGMARTEKKKRTSSSPGEVERKIEEKEKRPGKAEITRRINTKNDVVNSRKKERIRA